MTHLKTQFVILSTHSTHTITLTIHLQCIKLLSIICKSIYQFIKTETYFIIGNHECATQISISRMSKISLRTSNTRLLHQQKKKWPKMDVRLKPFGFCCSMDRFDPLSRYDQRMPPYKSSLTAITSVHECPVSKIQTQFFTPRLSRNKKRLGKGRMSEMEDQQRLGNDTMNYFHINRRDGSIKWYLEDEIALAKNIFWTEKQRVHNEERDKIISIAKKQMKKRMKYLLNLRYPRWYQDFSPNQMKNLMNLENVMRTDYEETTTSGTQKSLMAIGVVSTFFTLKPIVIKELHKSCNLNGVDFLREIYKILTGNDFLEEGYKKVYDCNERIILSAIAFLTLPQTVEELHKRLPPVIMPKLPPKPKPPTCFPRRKDSCPYKEELFRRSDWAGYRNKLQKWQKQYKLLAVPKVILPYQKYNQLLNNNNAALKFKKQGKNIYGQLEKDSAKELQKISATKLDQTSMTSIDYQLKHKKDFSKREISEVEKSIIDVPQLPDKKTLVLKPPRASQKSWLGEKDAHYVISGAYEDAATGSVTYEISGVANVTPSNSDERFFAVLKRDKPKKIFPGGRENLSRNWQEWLQNADEEFRQVEDEADELIKSIQSITKLSFPEPVCDSCCLCRQTRKTRERMRQSKAPYLLIDNIIQNDENKYIVGSVAMHSPGPSPTESPIDLLEMVASKDEITTNIIINGVTDHNGKTQYLVSGIQKDKIHIPSRVSEFPAPQPVIRNIPPCACAIQQMSKEDRASPSLSKDDISWTKDGGLCPGKKYRPNEPGAYSCKKYPGDKSCRRNPFMKEILKMKKKKTEEQGEEEQEGKAELIDTMKKEAKTVREKRKDKFIPDLNYPAYDYPWNLSRTAPSAEISKTDYELTLKLTSPVLPATSTSPGAQKRQTNISPSNKKLEKFAESTKNKDISDKASGNISLNLSKRFEEQKKERDTMDKNIKQDRNRPLNKILGDEKDTQFSDKISKSTAKNKIKKPQLKLPSNKIIKQQQPKNIVKKRSKRDKKKIAVDETEQLDGRKREMARLKNMLKLPIGILGDVQPALLPEELQAIRQSEEKTDDLSDSAISIDEEESRIRKGPCGWRTKSEQELPAKKTLAYLCEPDYPLESMAIRPGGRPCDCRENRSKKKILKYNVGGLVEKKDGRGARRTKLREENRIIDGVAYFTPPASPRRSDEYIPEYDLLESPYDMCVGEVTDERLKLIEKYSGPKSLIEKTRKRAKSCRCNSGVTKEARFADRKKDIEETRQKLMESKSPEERWTVALKDAALTDYFTQPRDRTRCWTSCRKYARSVRPRRLKVVKPVCECKNERKIVERNEERSRWKMRQRRLKALKKQAFMHVVDTSRPIVENTNLIISEVQRIPRKTEHEGDVKYCISGVAKDLSVSPPQPILDGLKMSTPFQTPEPSKEDIPSVALHRHWSPMDVPPGPLPRKDAALKEEMNRRKKARDEALTLIYGDMNERDSTRRTYQNVRDQGKPMQGVGKTQETWKSHKNVEEKTSGAVIELCSSSKKTDSEIKRQDTSREIIVSKVIPEDEKYFEEATGKIGYRSDTSYKQIIERTGEDEQRHQINDSDDKKRTSSQPNLTQIIKAELKKMSEEGYVFAKLPKCYLMPQLQDWIMHREGVAFSETDKKNLMRETVSIWQLIETVPMPKIETPSLHMTKQQLRRLIFDRAEEIKKKIEKEKATFHSGVRKARVSHARTMWSTMEFGKFPSASFKRAFFTYMASKEADGHVYRPWLTSEVCGRDPDFSCYQ
ncbi:uncharacterized protein LOC105275967 isoform X1 [Ooceraea biroi]|uniref:uncharacterized protein LOC105275967 isoform X1 n=1 Tax=Ooceraea biroi TaxID=2015173 RepID=UPI000F07D014|nr:uncharacterized protein LOC105275967 isoform X1 [Ooceraea biroi]